MADEGVAAVGEQQHLFSRVGLATPELPVGLRIVAAGKRAGAGPVGCERDGHHPHGVVERAVVVVPTAHHDGAVGPEGQAAGLVVQIRPILGPVPVVGEARVQVAVGSPGRGGVNER